MSMEDILCFVKDFLARMKRLKKAFTITDIEKSYNRQRKKAKKKTVVLDNMQRLIIVSYLLKQEFLKRTYQMTGYEAPYQMVFYAN
ncbi:hypothetical protein ACNZ6Z_002675 [Enterococcus faecalis]